MKYFISLLLVCVLIIGAVYATEGDIDIQEDILERIEARLKALDDSHSDFVHQKNETIRNIRSLEDSVRNTEDEIIVLKGQIEDNHVAIGVATIELEAANQTLDETVELLNDRIRIMYMNGSIGYLEVVLDSKNFEDLLSRIEMLRRIVESDTSLIDQLEIDKNNVDQKKQVLEAEQEKLVALEVTMQEKKNQLKAQIEQWEIKKLALEKDIEALSIQIADVEKDVESVKDIISELASTETFVGGDMIWPVVGNTKINDVFGMRMHPILKEPIMHRGLDIDGDNNTVVAALDGRVTWAGWLGSYGKCVTIDHGGGVQTLYGHNREIVIEKGAHVKQGDAIAITGSTGVATGEHLHFEVIVDGVHQDPLKYVKGD